ncbi:MAG: protein translocase subunit SecD [Deltaproteobacteria bacterium]|nr:MAG: protein translocase subunit SecD [Deltaproteobacteria bacterium]
MQKGIIWRALLAVFAIFIAVVYLIPSLPVYERLSGWAKRILPQNKIHLGLDLRGGIHLVLDVDVDKAVENHLDRILDELRHDMRKNRIRYRGMKRDGLKGINILLMRREDLKRLEDIIKRQYPDFKIEKRDNTLILRLLAEARNRIVNMAVDQALETIRNRVDQFGVSEPDIRKQQKNTILVQLPGIKDPRRAIKLIGKTALLEFKLVDDEHSVTEALRGRIPPGDEILYQMKIDPGTGKVTKIPFLLKKRTMLTGEYITDARVQIDPRTNEPYVLLSFDSRGARIFARITGENIKKRLAIVLDKKVYSAPVIQDRIAGGRAQITGAFTMEEAHDLAIVLRAGALPAPVKVIEERTVGPSLGRDSIEKGIKATIIGGIVVTLFMAIYYNLAGIIADLALMLNIIFIMSGLALFGATLTLPGIAGIILTIGMAVDANVLIFERIREELRLGKGAIAAIETGYGRAFVTILDANVTTLIAALVLFQFGTGPIRGFAVTLSIGIVASMFTAIFITRIIFDYLYVLKGMKKVRI